MSQWRIVNRPWIVCGCSPKPNSEGESKKDVILVKGWWSSGLVPHYKLEILVTQTREKLLQQVFFVSHSGRVFMQRRHNHGRRHRPQQFHEEEENEPVSQCTKRSKGRKKSKHFLTQHQILFLSLFQPLLHSLLQFMPILLLVGLSLMSSFMLQDPPYSLSRTG